MPLAFTFLFLALSACDLVANSKATPTVTQLPSIPTAANTPVQETTPITTTAIAPVTRSITLTIWTSTEIAPNSDVPGGAVLLEQLNAFENSHPDVTLFVELKTIADQGGTLSYLRTGRTVAPGILPDVVLLPASQLSSAAEQGLIFPLDESLEQEAVDDLYPVARELVHVDEQTLGYPFALTNLQHLAYNGSAITETVSGDWSQLVTDRPGMLIYPAADFIGAELTAHFYREFGGTFVDDLGQPALQVEPLVDALELIQLGVSEGYIDPLSGSTASLDQAWQIFQGNPTLFIQTTASFYLRRLAAGASTNLRVAPLPGPGGPVTPTVGAWTWAISTPEPARQALAAELIRWLTSGANMGEWSLESQLIPARRSAFEAWPQDAYLAFIQRQITIAQPMADGLNNTVLTALSDATTAVILGIDTPSESAAQAAAAVQP